MLADMDLAITPMNSGFNLSPSHLVESEQVSVQIDQNHHHHHHHHRQSPELSIASLSMASSSPGSVSISPFGGAGGSSSTGAGISSYGQSQMNASGVESNMLGVGVTVGLSNLDSYCIYNPQAGDFDSSALSPSNSSSAPEALTNSAAVASSSSRVGPDLPDTKEGIEELCPVCGDKVSGYHYGLLTCESCKGFFKRTVQNKKVYTCVADRSCHIDKSQRKRCPYCRFQKCLDVGMKLEAVRADRMRGGRNKFGPMYKRDRARKLQMIRERQVSRSGSSLGGSNSQQGPVASGGGSYDMSYAQNAGPAIYGVKHEIQIPQVSSLTSSPDSSPSPANLGYPGPSNQLSGSMGGGGATANGGGASGPGPAHPHTPSPTLHQSGAPLAQHPASLSPKSFHFEGLLNSATNSGSSSLVMSNNNSSAMVGSAKVPPLIREFVQSLDDKEWQSALFGLLQSQTYNQCEVDLFELLCKVLDQNLFTQVDWARNSYYFKDLKVDDQMKLLQHAWSDLLILDHLHQRLHNHLPDETTLPNGQKFELLSLALLGCPALADPILELANKLNELRFDVSDYVCLKFLVLLSPDVKGLMNRRHVAEAHDQVQQALFDYTLNCYSHVPDKFSKLLGLLGDLHSISTRGEEYLYFKHLNGCAPTQTLLMEMLHAKRK